MSALEGLGPEATPPAGEAAGIRLRRHRRPNGHVRTSVSKDGKEIGYVDRRIAPNLSPRKFGVERIEHEAHGHPYAKRLGSFDTRREAVEAIVAHAAKPREPRA